MAPMRAGDGAPTTKFVSRLRRLHRPCWPFRGGAPPKSGTIADQLRGIAAKIDADLDAHASEYSLADVLRELAEMTTLPWWAAKGDQVINALLARAHIATSSACHGEEHIQLINDARAKVDRILADAMTIDRGEVFGLRTGLRAPTHPSEGSVDDARQRLRALAENDRLKAIEGETNSPSIPFDVMECLEMMRPLRDGRRERYADRWVDLSPEQKTEREKVALRGLIEREVGFSVAREFTDVQLEQLLAAWGRTKADKGQSDAKWKIVNAVFDEVFGRNDGHRRRIDAESIWKKGRRENRSAEIT
jgi:hypothetical protein